MCTGDTTWADLEDLMKHWLDGERFGGGDHFSISAYGLSKAALMVFTMQMAAKYPNIKVRKINFNVIMAKINPHPSFSPPVYLRDTSRLI